MKYPKEYLDEIKLRLKVSQVVGKYVKLKKRGKEFIGLSPFSNEKTPSFTVNDEKGFYHCFSSAEHGNIFDFLMKTKNYKFGEAVRELAAEAGMRVYKFSVQDEEKQNRLNIYNSILEKYTTLCHEELISGKHNEINNYLDKRKLTNKEIAFFKIGYSPQNNNFYEKLKSEFNETQINSSGIFYIDDKTKKSVDRFRNRIIFPVKGLNNSVLALGGRSILKNAFAKYINSPETEFFKKGYNLYNISNAKSSRNKDDVVFIVEGYMDVINLHKFGIENVVANLGTAMTESQINLIWRFFKNPIICLDGDISGQKAALRAAERLFPLIKTENNIYFLKLPENFDPDSFVNEKGKYSFLELAKNKTNIQNFIWDKYFEEVDINDPQSLSVFEKKIKNLCMEMQDKTLAKYFLEHFSKKILELTPSLNFKKNKFVNFKKARLPLQETKKIYTLRSKFSEIALKEYSFFYLIINYLDYFNDHIEQISEIKISDNLLNSLRNEIVENIISNKQNIEKKLNVEKIDKKFKEIILQINKFAPVKLISKNKNKNDIIKIFNEIADEIKKIELNTKIAQLEAEVAKDMDEKVYNELLSLKNHLKSG